MTSITNHLDSAFSFPQAYFPSLTLKVMKIWIKDALISVKEMNVEPKFEEKT